MVIRQPKLASLSPNQLGLGTRGRVRSRLSYRAYHPAIYQQILAGDEAGLITQQERHNLGELLQPSGAAERDRLHNTGVDRVAIDEARQNGIYADAVRGRLL